MSSERPPKQKKLPKDQTTLEKSFANMDQSRQPSSSGLGAGLHIQHEADGVAQ